VIATIPSEATRGARAVRDGPKYGGRRGGAPGGTDSPPGKTHPFRGASGGGVFRNTDMGDSFVRLSGDGSSGLPDQAVSNLVADPGNRNR